MRVPIKKGGKMIWIVLEPSLIAGTGEIEKFIKEQITPIRISQENGLLRIVELAQKRGLCLI